jgi:hypothetical protein
MYRQFSSDFIPEPTGTPVQRGAAVPVPGIVKRRWMLKWGKCGDKPWNLCPIYEPRQSLALWFPQDGKFNVNWNPTTSNAVARCPLSLGSVPSSMPLGGLGVNLASGFDSGLSDLAAYHALGTNPPGWLWIRSGQEQDGCPSSPLRLVELPQGSTRTQVFSVGDMTGDGRAEIVVLDPDGFNIGYLTSESDFQQYMPVPIGDQLSVFL